MTRAVEVGSRTDAGGREENEDACAITSSGPLEVVILADGAGGHAGGEIASRLVVEASLDYFKRVDPGDDPSGLLRGVLHASHRAVRDYMKTQPRLRDMRSTAIVLLGTAKEAWIGHVGDSRAYLIRDGKPERLTRDDTLVQSLVDLGQLDDEGAKTHSKANVLMQSIGDPKALEYHVAGPVEVREGDRIVICSDGLWELMTDADLATIASQGDPHTVANALVDRAVASTPSDNITAGVMHWTATGARPSTGRGHGAVRRPRASRKKRSNRSSVLVLALLLLIVLIAAGIRMYRHHMRRASLLGTDAHPARMIAHRPPYTTRGNT